MTRKLCRFSCSISTQNPDLSTCILHQKLQMLNCCIVKKRHRESATTPDDVIETPDDVTQSVLGSPQTETSALPNGESAPPSGQSST